MCWRKRLRVLVLMLVVLMSGWVGVNSSITLNIASNRREWKEKKCISLYINKLKVKIINQLPFLKIEVTMY